MKFILSSIIICLILGLQKNLVAQINDVSDNCYGNLLILNDTTHSKVYKDSIVVPSTPLVVLGEIGLGSLLAIASTGLTAGISSQLVDTDYRYVILAAYIAYSFGHSFGVYIIGKENNKDTSFLELFGVSLLTAAVSAYVFYESDQIGTESLLPAIMPLLAPLIYTNVVYPPQSQKLSVEMSPNLSLRENCLQYGMNFTITF